MGWGRGQEAGGREGGRGSWRTDAGFRPVRGALRTQQRKIRHALFKAAGRGGRRAVAVSRAPALVHPSSRHPRRLPLPCCGASPVAPHTQRCGAHAIRVTLCAGSPETVGRGERWWGCGVGPVVWSHPRAHTLTGGEVGVRTTAATAVDTAAGQGWGEYRSILRLRAQPLTTPGAPEPPPSSRRRHSSGPACVRPGALRGARSGGGNQKAAKATALRY